jgi:tetratricopeptide (TPR) repeat protein
MNVVGSWVCVMWRKLGVASARRGKDRLKYAHRLRHLGDAYWSAGQTERAERHFVEALSIYRGRPDARPLDVANALRGFALAKHGLGEAAEAQRLWEEAHDLYATLNVQSGVAESAARLALLASRRSDLPKSQQYLVEARAAADASADDETRQYVRQVAVLMQARP